MKDMTSRKRHLAAGENVVFHTRAHWKEIVVPALVLVIVAAGAIWLLTQTSALWLQWTIAIIAIIVVAITSVIPILNWLANTSTLTTHRLISRWGLVRRIQNDVALDRVDSINIQRGFLDRFLGAGRLLVHATGTDGDLVLEGVPRIKERHMQMQELLMNRKTGANPQPK